MRIYLCADTQEVEGINSIIRHLCTQCKHIGLVLVNSRVIIKKALGLGSKSQPVKWSHRRPHALAMLRSSMQHYDEGRRIIKEELYRWDAAQRDVPLTHVQHQMIACQRQTDSMSDPLVKLNSLLLHRAMKQPDVTTLLTFVKLSEHGHGAAHQHAPCWIIAVKRRAASRAAVYAFDNGKALLTLPIQSVWALHTTIACCCSFHALLCALYKWIQCKYIYVDIYVWGNDHVTMWSCVTMRPCAAYDFMMGSDAPFLCTYHTIVLLLTVLLLVVLLCWSLFNIEHV